MSLWCVFEMVLSDTHLLEGRLAVTAPFENSGTGNQRSASTETKTDLPSLNQFLHFSNGVKIKTLPLEILLEGLVEV